LIVKVNVADPVPLALGAIPEMTPVVVLTESPAGRSNGVQDQLGCPLAGGTLSPYALASIKELVVLALKSKRKFRWNGASASDIRDFIKDAFGRDIERASLSPQLSRLRHEGILKLSNDGTWTLTTDSGNKAPTGDDHDGAPKSPDVGG